MKKAQTNDKIAIKGLKYIAQERKNGKMLDEEVFFALCNSVLVCSVELMCLTDSGKILLIKRPISDKYYSNQWHSPGTIFMKGENIKVCIKRVRNVELKQFRKLGDPVFMGVQEIEYGESGGKKDPRQQVISLLYIQKVQERDDMDNSKSKFFKLDKIPKNTIGTHKKLLLPFLKSFLKKKNVEIRYSK